MDTLLLTADWDLAVNADGNIATATGSYQLAQDAASAIRTFLGEVYYDTTIGVPYWQLILGKWPPLSLLKSSLVSAALTVPGVVSAKCFLSGITDRTVSGQVQVVDSTGTTSAAAF
jgi:hypothetical protein